MADHVGKSCFGKIKASLLCYSIEAVSDESVAGTGCVNRFNVGECTLCPLDIPQTLVAAFFAKCGKEQPDIRILLLKNINTLTDVLRAGCQYKFFFRNLEYIAH